MPTAVSFDTLGILNATDKCSLSHDYLRHYERLCAPYRDLPITLLEIGIGSGGSLSLWEAYFPRATIVGVDIRADCRRFQGGRRIVEIASQDEPAAMAALAQHYDPTIVVDDGSHRADHVMTSFQAIFPILRPGSLYIVEDMEAHSGVDAHRFRGAASISPQQYFLTLANRIVCPRDPVEFDPTLRAMVDAIEFIGGIVAIHKRALPDPDHIEQRFAVAQMANHPRVWAWLTTYIRRYQGDLRVAADCARRALALSPGTPRYYLLVARSLLDIGERVEACAILASGVQRGIADESVRALLAELQRTRAVSG